jgi:hypothetical protein
MGSARSNAQQLAWKKFKNINSNSVYWPWLDYGSVYSGIIDRIDDPGLIWQSTTNLCGMASAMNALAMDDPYLYAFYACELYRCGAAYLGYGKEAPLVKPSKATRGSKPPHSMHPTDWLTLAGLRDHLNDTLDYAYGMGVPLLKDIPLLGFFGNPKLVERLAAINYPSDLVTMLKAVGYTKVVDHAVWSVHASSTRVTEANSYLSAGYRVLLLINTAMYDIDLDGSTPSSQSSNHWVRLKSKFKIKQKQFKDENGIKFAIYDPQSSDKKDTSSMVPWTGGYMRHSSFMLNFYGFIAAKH